MIDDTKSMTDEPNSLGWRLEGIGGIYTPKLHQVRYDRAVLPSTFEHCRYLFLVDSTSNEVCRK
jgi:hypothetical protein